MNRDIIHQNYLRNAEKFISPIEIKIESIDLFEIYYPENWINQKRYTSKIIKNCFLRKIFSQSYPCPIKEFCISDIPHLLIQKFLGSECQFSFSKTFSRIDMKYFYISINQERKKKINLYSRNYPCM
jgi:hypothetical protein